MTSTHNTPGYFVDNTHPGVIYTGTAQEVERGMEALINDGGDPVRIEAEKAERWVADPGTSPVPSETWELVPVPAHWSRTDTCADAYRDRSYPSKNQARRAATNIQYETGVRMEPYRCVECDGVHVRHALARSVESSS